MLAHGDCSGADDVADAEGHQLLHQGVDLLPLTCRLDDQAILHHLGHAAMIVGHQREHSVQRGVALRPHIDEHHLALKMGAAGEVFHVQYAHQLIDLLDDLLDGAIVAGGDQSDAGDGGIERLGHGEALNVVAARAEQADDAGEFAVMVLNHDGKRVSHSSARSAMPPPGGTMGKTFSSTSTMMSITTTPGVERPFSSTACSSDGWRARRPVAP